MPVYVYKNLTTGGTFEVQQRISENALTADPVTGDPVKRLVQPVGIAFKGSGFYVNDSRGKKGANSIVKYDGSKSEGGKSDAGKSDGAGSASVAASSSDGGSSGSASEGTKSEGAKSSTPAATPPKAAASGGRSD